MEGRKPSLHGSHPREMPHLILRHRGGVSPHAGEDRAPLDPEEGPLYRQRGEDVKHSLHELHQEIARQSAGWTKRKIVTFHASMNYFAERYGLEVVAVVEPVPGQEPTARHLAEVLEILKKTQAALFSEPQLDPRPARVLASEAGVPLYEIDPQGAGPSPWRCRPWWSRPTDRPAARPRASSPAGSGSLPRCWIGRPESRSPGPSCSGRPRQG